MPAINITGFLGCVSALDPRLLPADVGVSSSNQKPQQRELTPWRSPYQVATVPTTVQRKTIWRMGQDIAGDTNYWLSWTTTVHCVRGFDTNDTNERTYYTGNGSPKWTDNTKALTGGPPYPQGTPRELSVPAPATTPTLTQTVAGSGTAYTISFLQTFVNDIGWESAPGTPSATLTVQPGCTVTVGNLDSGSGFSTAQYNLTVTRLYLAITASDGSAQFYFIAQAAIGTTSWSYTGQATGAVLATGGSGVGSSWLPPPTDGHGMATLWNGMYSILSGKTAYVSVPYMPYAYPVRNQIALPEPIVAQGIWGQRALLLTTADAYVMAGSDPSSLEAKPLKIKQPCASDRGVVSFEDGVVWASPTGLQWYGNDGWKTLSEDVLNYEQWAALNPSTMMLARYKDLKMVFVFYNDGTGNKGLVFDLLNDNSYYPLSIGADAVFQDPISANLYILQGGNVMRWDAQASGTYLTATFRSKKMRQLDPVNLGVMEVIASAYPVHAKVWADGNLVMDRDVLSGDPVRTCAAGITAMDWQLEVSSANSVQGVRVAAEVSELRQ